MSIQLTKNEDKQIIPLIMTSDTVKGNNHGVELINNDMTFAFPFTKATYSTLSGMVNKSALFTVLFYEQKMRTTVSFQARLDEIKIGAGNVDETLPLVMILTQQSAFEYVKKRKSIFDKIVERKIRRFNFDFKWPVKKER